jgi:hypothetical protein
MTMNPVGRKVDAASQKLIDEYLAKGGNVTVGEKYARSEDIGFTGGFYGRRKKSTNNLDAPKED